MATSSAGIGCSGWLVVLGIVFTILKLTDHIDWAWGWVLAPFIAAGILYVLALLFVVWVISKVGTIQRRADKHFNSRRLP